MRQRKRAPQPQQPGAEPGAERGECLNSSLLQHCLAEPAALLALRWYTLALLHYRSWPGLRRVAYKAEIGIRDCAESGMQYPRWAGVFPAQR